MRREQMENNLNHFENVLRISLHYILSARSYLAVATKFREQGNLGEAAKYLRLAGVSRRASASLRQDVIRCRQELLEGCHD